MTSANVTFIKEKKDKQPVELATKYISAAAIPQKGDIIHLIAGYEHEVIERHFTYGNNLCVAIFVQEKSAETP